MYEEGADIARRSVDISPWSYIAAALSGGATYFSSVRNQNEEVWAWPAFPHMDVRGAATEPTANLDQGCCAEGCTTESPLLHPTDDTRRFARTYIKARRTEHRYGDRGGVGEGGEVREERR